MGNVDKRGSEESKGNGVRDGEGTMKSERFYGGKDRVYGNYASLTRRGQTRPNI